MRTGCVRLQVAPATSNCISSRSAGRSQGQRSWRAVSTRTLDGELALRLSTIHSDTQHITISTADLTACQRKFHFLQLIALSGLNRE